MIFVNEATDKEKGEETIAYMKDKCEAIARIDADFRETTSDLKSVTVLDNSPNDTETTKVFGTYLPLKTEARIYIESCVNEHSSMATLLHEIGHHKQHRAKKDDPEEYVKFAIHIPIWESEPFADAYERETIEKYLIKEVQPPKPLPERSRLVKAILFLAGKKIKSESDELRRMREEMLQSRYELNLLIAKQYGLHAKMCEQRIQKYLAKKPATA